LVVFFGPAPVHSPFPMIALISDVALIVLPAMSLASFQKRSFRTLASEVLAMTARSSE
jgi:hypothetical protein